MKNISPLNECVINFKHLFKNSQRVKYFNIGCRVLNENF